jgi:hypothetical protein
MNKIRYAMPLFRSRQLPFLLVMMAMTIPGTLWSMEIVQTSTKEGSAPRPLFLPSKPDGRVVFYLHPGPATAGLPEGPVGRQIESLVSRGCVVAMMGTGAPIDALTASGDIFEKSWRGIWTAVENYWKSKGSGGEMRMIYMMPGTELADPIPFFEHKKTPLYLDVVYRPEEPPRGIVVRVQSGVFGAEPIFRAAAHGYATVQIPDPFHILGLSGDAVEAYARAIATTLQKHRERLRLNGALAIGGKSKHGYASGVLGAVRGTDGKALFHAILAITDTYDPATRSEDFIAAGIRVDGNPGEDNADRYSPVRMVGPGGPAYFLMDAHGRTTRQSKRMIEALEKAGLPYQQTWYADMPNYVKKSGDAPVRFLDLYLKPPTG